MKGKSLLFHDIRSSLNGVICMGSLLKDTDLNEEQADLLKYMLLSADKTLTLINEFQNKYRSTPLDDQPLPAVPAAESPGEPLSVLVAEDDEVSRLYLTTLLKREHWKIDEASDGKEALELFEQNEYQVILMDVSMPGVDGIHAARKIREKNPLVPILAITAHGEGELQEEFRMAGMTDVLRKPIHDEFLIGKIKSLCSIS